MSFQTFKLNPARAALALLCAALVGCGARQEFYFHGSGAQAKTSTLDIDSPVVQTSYSVDDSLPPRTVEQPHLDEMWDLTLEETLRIALINSTVLRDLGGQILTNPEATNSIYAPAIVETNPRIGVEAALSAFDAQFSTNLFWQRNDRPLNTFFPGLFQQVFEQDVGTFRTQVAKTAATGGRFALRNNTNYEWNNSPTNLFPSAWDTNIEAEVRHPLLQGAGVDFNRIAGPNAQPGLVFNNGVLISRINTDISLADFEGGVQRLVSDVENAYWDLYFAYRNLDAAVKGRDSTLATWRRVQALFEVGQRGGEADQEAQARSQYYLFQSAVENALSGLPGRSTISGSGSSAGLFAAGGGVYARENNLRYLMGLPPNDGRLIRPVDEPITSPVAFSWEDVVTEALERRVELRRQMWIVKRRELELVAARNFLLPRLDVVGLYRWRGFGNDLIDPNGPGGFDNAVQNLTEGDYQEWQTGVQFSMPIGFRRQHAAHRNAELQLATARAVMREQEAAVLHDLTGAIRELERSYQVMKTNFNRVVASRNEVEATRDAYEVGRTTLDIVLDAQRRSAVAESDYFRTVVEYNLAIKSVHFEKGSMLDVDGIYLAESGWSAKAHLDARRNADRLVTRAMDYRFRHGPILSQGAYEATRGVLPRASLSPPTEDALPPPPANNPAIDPAPAPPPAAPPIDAAEVERVRIRL